MSLLTEIQNNTSSVINGKLNLAQAIENKGGILSDYMLVPSFSNLVDGVNSIKGTAVNGAITTKIHATDYIKQGDVLELKRALGGFSFTGEYNKLPATVQHGGKDCNIFTAIPPEPLSEDILVVFSQRPTYSNSVSAVYLILIDGQYHQLTVDGVYTFANSTPSMSSSLDMYVHYNRYLAFAFDSATDILYVGTHTTLYAYKLDRTTLNLTKLTTLSITSSYTSATFDLYAHNNNIFVSYGTTSSSTIHYHYSSTSNTISFKKFVHEYVTSKSDSGTTRAAFDYVYDEDDNLYIYLTFYESGVRKNCIHKMTLDSASLYQSTKQTLYIPDVRADIMKWDSSTVELIDNSSEPSLNMSRGCKFAVYIDTSGYLHHINIDTNTMTITGELDLPLSDSVGRETITGIKLVKDADLLFLISGSDDYDTYEKLRVYQYDNSYKFVCCPALDFEPTTQVLTLPVTFSHNLYNNTIVMSKTTGYPDTYKISRLEADYDYTGEPCNNMLTDVKAYGLATEDINMGETKEGLIILS